ncbi:MAG: hypothetical protein BWY47_01295 [Bacteroidetes bacterium ADurb.Bin302]|nr:MAG: hypothetical protein BWY47_01295 [Bacteroidetes bacterium ADurb.Bin302]
MKQETIQNIFSHLVEFIKKTEKISVLLLKELARYCNGLYLRPLLFLLFLSNHCYWVKEVNILWEWQLEQTLFF